MKNKIIHMTLTYRWFDLIESGRKDTEYRRWVPGWQKRLEGTKEGDRIIFHRGYTDRTCVREIESVEVVTGWDLPNEEYRFFGCPNESAFFKIKIRPCFFEKKC